MPMFRYPLIFKIAVFVIGLGTVFTIASLYVFDRVISNRVLTSVGKQLITSQRVVRQILDHEQDFLHAVAMSHAEMLASKGEDADSAYCVTWWESHLDEAGLDLIQMEDPEGNIIFQVIRDHPEAAAAPAMTPLGQLRFYHDDRYLYQIAGHKIPGSRGLTLIVGKRIDSQWVWGLSETTHSRMAVFTGSEFLAVSVDSSLLQPLKSSLPWDPSAQDTPCEVMLGEHRMMVMCEGLPGSRSPNLCFLLLRDLEPELTVLTQVRRSIGVLAFVALAISTLIGIIVAWRMIYRIQRLVRASEALTEGDENFPLTVSGADEIAQLTRQFVNMRGTLQQRHAELNHLNERLQAQMEELSQTQKQLVQTEKLATVGRLTAQLSHELNNPICNIQNCIEVLEKQCTKDSDSSEYVGLIRDEIRRMSKLIRQLLDFHRPSSDEFTPTDVNELIDTVVRLSKNQLNKQGIDVQMTLDRELPPVVGIVDQLKQVVLNLVLNAADAMQEGGILRISTTHENEHVVLHVEDSGIGMDEETRDKVFDAFFTTKQEVAGVGLGLSVSYSIVRQHGGWMDVDSEQNRGTVFHVHLPLSPAYIEESGIAS